MTTESAAAVGSLKGGGCPANPPKAEARPRRYKQWRLGPYSGVGATAGLDGRSCEYRYYKKCRDELVAYLGGNLSAVQRELIEQASWLKVRIGMMNRRLAEDGGKHFTTNDSGQYLAWANSLSRIVVLPDLTRGKGGKHPRYLRSRTALEAPYNAPGNGQKTVADLVDDNP
jgi:hypothetical protein